MRITAKPKFPAIGGLCLGGVLLFGAALGMSGVRPIPVILVAQALQIVVDDLARLEAIAYGSRRG